MSIDEQSPFFSLVTVKPSEDEFPRAEATAKRLRKANAVSREPEIN
jgi:hypothetical protein